MLPKSVHHAHDHFFKHLFGDSSNARDLLPAHAPPELLVQLDLGSLEFLNSTFVEAALAENFSDPVCQVPVDYRSLRDPTWSVSTELHGLLDVPG